LAGVSRFGRIQADERWNEKRDGVSATCVSGWDKAPSWAMRCGV
jgi:hypothetical protein